MHKTVYQEKVSGDELQVTWSTNGILFSFKYSDDGHYSFEIEEYDCEVLIDELQCYLNAIKEENTCKTSG